MDTGAITHLYKTCVSLSVCLGKLDAIFFSHHLRQHLSWLNHLVDLFTVPSTALVNPPWKQDLSRSAGWAKTSRFVHQQCLQIKKMRIHHMPGGKISVTGSNEKLLFLKPHLQQWHTWGWVTPPAGAGQKLCQVPHTTEVYQHLPGVADKQHLPTTFAMQITQNQITGLDWNHLEAPQQARSILDPQKIIKTTPRSQNSQSASPCAPFTFTRGVTWTVIFYLDGKWVGAHWVPTLVLALLKLRAAEMCMVQENCLELKGML